MEQPSQEDAIEQFKIKKMIQRLKGAKGAGTSMISLIIPPNKAISDCSQKLTEEIARATQIKDKINRTSVQDAIQFALARLKLWGLRSPKNGLVLYTGIVVEESKGEHRLMVDFEPFKPLNKQIYFCDSKFHVDELLSLLDNDVPFGIIVVDGQGALYATLSGNITEVVNKFEVDLPKKHNKGGQSSVRFARLRLEKRQAYLKKVCEKAVSAFIENDKPTVQGLVLAGSGDIKSQLNDTQHLDLRLQKIILKVVDVQYGGTNGMNQAIQLAEECLSNVKFVQEKNIVSKFFEEVSMDTGMVIYGISDTMKALEAQSLKSIMCNETLDWFRVERKNKENGSTDIIYIPPNELTADKHYKDGEMALDFVEYKLITEYLAENFRDLSVELNFVTDKSAEGGLGGYLRYKQNIDYIVNQDLKEWEFDDDDFI